jgi:hypothetical protein
VVGDNQGIGWETGQPVKVARFSATNAAAAQADQQVVTNDKSQIPLAQLFFDLSRRDKRPIMEVAECALEMLGDESVLASWAHMVFSFVVFNKEIHRKDVN